MRGATYTSFLLAVLLASAAPGARAHEPGGENELPGGGTLHELRITLLTSFTAAQGITQRIICGTPSVCFQDELHLPVVIDFATGEIAIDATVIEDENEAVARVLFNTLSGPAELTFEPPCTNPDGCVGGTPVYLGTIDTQGNVTFPSVGISFEVFGLSPIAAFDGAMGTGTFVDESDPSTVAQGTPLDFTTGDIVLEGLQFVEAPIVGTILQVNRIEAQIVPIPVPPVATKSLLKCQKKIQREGARFVKTKQKELTKCVEALLLCEFLDETGAGAGPSCVSDALEICQNSLTKIDAAESRLKDKILKSCGDEILAPNLLAPRRGLGFGVSAAQCAAFGLGQSSKDSIADCIVERLECSVEEMVALLEPRAGEVLGANGLGQFVDPNGCVPRFADGDGAGASVDFLGKCQTKLGKEGGKLVKVKQKELQKCIAAQLECEIREEIDGLEGAEHDACHAVAEATCAKAIAKTDKALGKFEQRVKKACPIFNTSLEQGLGLDELEPVCGTVSSIDDLVQCLQSKLECAVDGVARSVEPRAEDALGEPNEGIPEVLARFSCLTPSCGDGIIDSGEACDPLIPDGICEPTCIIVVCGNGTIEGDEECDDGNTGDGDGCSSTCIIEPTLCGNGLLEPEGGEVCDDGDTHGGDGCSPNCLSDETCGNGVLDTIVGEVCDDGGDAFEASLDGSQAVPPVVSGATGTATIDLDPNDALVYSVTTTGLVGGTDAHIHEGFFGVGGPIIFPLVGDPGAGIWSGTTRRLTATELNILRSGGYYVNVHTSANPGGEVRGQIEFAAPVSGDGCSDDCLSDETCGNGVIDSVTGEACDDGNTTGGDGCDAGCTLEACAFDSVAALGTRSFTIDTDVGGLFNSLVGLPPNPAVGPVGFVSGALDLVAGPTDAGGNASVTLGSDVFLGFAISLATPPFTQCFKIEAAGSTGTLHCCGGHAVDTSFTRDSNTGGSGGNGPGVALSGLGTGGPGDLELDLVVSESFSSLEDPNGCLTATYGSPSTRFRFWTTGTATGRVIRPLQDPNGVFEFSTSGQAFDCSAWTATDDVGKIVNTDTALNAIPGFQDAVNLRFFDDEEGN